MFDLRTAVVMQAAYQLVNEQNDDSKHVFIGMVKYLLRKRWELSPFEQVNNNMIVDFVIANFG